MFAQFNRHPENETTDCPCFTCFLYGQRLVCHSRWRPQAVDPATEAASGWTV